MEPLLFLLSLVIAFIIISTARWKWHPLWALLLGSMAMGLGAGLGGQTTLAMIGEGFGRMMQQIGLIVVLGAVLGVVLESTGGAEAIAAWLLRFRGGKSPVLMQVGIGAVVSIPVFCDSGFIILSRLNRAIALRTGVPPASLALGLAGGLYTTHTLVPPTPGPVAAAGNLGAADYLGWIMLLGLAVSVPVLFVVWWWASRMGPKVETVLPEAAPAGKAASGLPSPAAALAPVLLPVVLIGSGTLLPEGHALRWLGLPPVALSIGVLAAFVLLGWRQWGKWSEWTATGIRLAGPVLVITGVGGSLGTVIKATPFSDICRQWAETAQPSQGLLLLFAFGLAALLKTAQGSSTSALVIASSILAPIAAALGIDAPYTLALLVLATGAGAMTVSHANDSYFWVVSQFSGIPPAGAFRSFTVMTGVMGITALLAIWVLWMWG